ncbi:TPA: YheC/YheD family protein [Candidatus Woesearchaeota archaeon]|nr:YheC/YheD family protein [Candidatus Woesearchaeota archaeon]
MRGDILVEPAGQRADRVYLSKRQRDSLGVDVGKELTISYEGKSREVKVVSAKEAHAKEKSKLRVSKNILGCLGIEEGADITYNYEDGRLVISPGVTVGVYAPQTGTGDKPYRKQTTFFKELTEEGRKIGVQVCVFAGKDYSAQGKTVDAQFYDPETGRWARKQIKMPEVVYDRGAGMTSAVHKAIQDAGTLLNPRELGLLVGDKQATHDALHKKGVRYDTKVRQPETHSYSKKNLGKMIDNHGTVFLKPRAGSQGTGIIRVKKLEDKFEVKYEDKTKHVKRGELHDTVDSAASEMTGRGVQSDYIVQQGIDLPEYNDAVFDVRVMLHKDEKGRWQRTSMMARVGKKGRVNSNTSTGGSGVRLSKIISDLYGQGFSHGRQDTVANNVRQAAHSTAEAIEAHLGKPVGELGVDICLDREGNAYVIEANSKPGRGVKALDQEFRQKSVRSPLLYSRYLAKKMRKARRSRLMDERAA